MPKDIQLARRIRGERAWTTSMVVDDVATLGSHLEVEASYYYEERFSKELVLPFSRSSFIPAVDLEIETLLKLIFILDVYER